MINTFQLDIIKQGRKAWERWRQEHPTTKIDLSQADVREADVNVVNLKNADLSGADLADASVECSLLVNVVFREALLKRANFSEAALNHADFHSADLTGVLFIQATLEKACSCMHNIEGVDLREADVTEANVQATWLCHAN